MVAHFCHELQNSVCDNSGKLSQRKKLSFKYYLENEKFQGKTISLSSPSIKIFTAIVSTGDIHCIYKQIRFRNSNSTSEWF